MVGDKIKERRIELGLSQLELAKRMGYTNKSTISKIENNLLDISQKRIKEFSECLQTTIPYLMGFEEANVEMQVELGEINDQRERYLSMYERYMTLNEGQKELVNNLVDALSEKE